MYGSSPCCAVVIAVLCSEKVSMIDDIRWPICHSIIAKCEMWVHQADYAVLGCIRKHTWVFIRVSKKKGINLKEPSNNFD